MRHKQNPHTAQGTLYETQAQYDAAARLYDRDRTHRAYIDMVRRDLEDARDYEKYARMMAELRG